MGLETDFQETAFTNVLLRLTEEECGNAVRLTKIKDTATAVKHIFTTGMWMMRLADKNAKSTAAVVSQSADYVKAYNAGRFHIVDEDSHGEAYKYGTGKLAMDADEKAQEKQITRKQWDEVADDINAKGVMQVSDEERDEFWRHLYSHNFKNKNGRTITTYNVKITFDAWQSIRTKEAEKEEEQRLEAEKRAQEEEEAHDRRNRYMLREVPED